MTVQVYNSAIRQYVWEAITILLDNYYRYGFLYDKNGNIKLEFLNTYTEYLEDGTEGPLKDADGDEVISEKYLYENLYDLPRKYQHLNPYLDVHSNVHFDQFDWRDIRYMNNSQIQRKFFGDSMEKLIGMLRHGNNYAMTIPVSSEVSDEYLKDTICFIWKMMVLDTMNVHDVKKKYFVPGHKYYEKGEEKNYAWDSRPYSNRIKDVEDVVVHEDGNIKISFNTNQDPNKITDSVKTRKAKESRILGIIDKSLSEAERERSIAYQFQKIVNDSSEKYYEINEADSSVKEPSIANRMAHIFKIYK